MAKAKQLDSFLKLKHTKEAISVPQLLNLDIKHKKEICKKILEIKEVDSNLISIDNLIDCQEISIIISQILKKEN